VDVQELWKDGSSYPPLLASQSIPSHPIADRQWRIGIWDVLRDWFVIIIDIKPLIANQCNIVSATSAGMEDHIIDGNGNGDADGSTPYLLSRRSSRG
jgi:hypothetical protein